MKASLRIVALFAALLTTAGCGVSSSTPSSDTIPQLTVYTSHKKEVYGPVIKEFQERTGIWVQVEEAGTNELLARISGEPAACDIMFGGGVESLEAYSDCFLPYQTTEADAIDRAFRSKENVWTPFSALPLVFLYNTKLLTAETAPKGWRELLQPQWSGKVAYANPNISGSCYTALATAIQASPQWEQGETVEAFWSVTNDCLLDSS
ncbi:MAG: extracellular solute-binding protein, partial [Angelakisella sp.]